MSFKSLAALEGKKFDTFTLTSVLVLIFFLLLLNLFLGLDFDYSPDDFFVVLTILYVLGLLVKASINMRR